MQVTTDAPYLDEQTGMIIEIVRNAETGEIIGKNERMPEEAPE